MTFVFRMLSIFAVIVLVIGFVVGGRSWEWNTFSELLTIIGMLYIMFAMIVYGVYGGDILDGGGIPKIIYQFSGKNEFEKVRELCRQVGLEDEPVVSVVAELTWLIYDISAATKFRVRKLIVEVSYTDTDISAANIGKDGLFTSFYDNLMGITRLKFRLSLTRLKSKRSDELLDQSRRLVCEGLMEVANRYSVSDAAIRKYKAGLR